MKRWKMKEEVILQEDMDNDSMDTEIIINIKFFLRAFLWAFQRFLFFFCHLFKWIKLVTKSKRAVYEVRRGVKKVD